MNDFDDITEDIEWRKEQLLIAKTLPFLHDFSDSHKEFLIKYTIPTIYAVWEGFVQNSFQIYIRELNKLNLTKNDFCLNILTHTIESSFPQLKEYPQEFNKRINFINRLNNYLQETFIITSIINTQSNVELEVLNRLLHRFNLDLIPVNPYRIQLQTLLKFRNRIAHGDISLVINHDNMDDFKERIEKFIILIIDLMEKVHNIMHEGFNNSKSYLKPTV